MSNGAFVLDEVLLRLGVSLAQLKEVWASGGALALDWLHADSDGDRNCMASIQFMGGEERRRVFDFEGCDFLVEKPKAIFGRLLLVETSRSVEVKGNFEDFCELVAKIQECPAHYETGAPICAALAIEESKCTD